tara:strand:- start:241899 stop:244076 length:2178 start_codon:yes stop_codon:yes gene_type:complete
MARTNRPNAKFKRQRQTGSSGRREGKIVLLAAIVILLVAVLMAWIGNTGHAVKQKMEVQSAADATSFAGSMWMARGMNAITLSNHLIGEATAMGVIHDAIGGPEMRLGLKTNTPENRTLDAIIRNLTKFAPIGKLYPNNYVPSPITNLDARLLEFVQRRTSPDSNPDLTAFATLYDARMTLQRYFAVTLGAKALANIVLMIPRETLAVPIVGAIVAAAVVAAIATHVASSAVVVSIGKEWLLLEALETYAKAANPVQEKAFSQLLVPTLVQFPAAIAGLDPEDPNSEPDGGFAVEKIKKVINDAGDQQNVQAQMVPLADDRRLPVRFEPPPNMNGRSGGWPQGWGSDEAINLPDASAALESMKGKLDDIVESISDATKNGEDAIEDLEDSRDSIQKKIDDGDLSDDVKAEYEEEIAAIDDTIESIRAELEKLEEQKNELEEQRKTIQNNFPLPSGQSQNLSLQHIPERMDPQQERTTQWVRASIPNVDALRAPILGLMKAQMPMSGAAKHYEKWTNRYTLIRAWKFRSGMRLEKTSNAAAQWTGNSADPMSMVVMDGSFEQETSIKGKEVWTRSDDEGKRLAEEQFTLLTAVHREYESLMATDVLRNAQNDGMTSFAQSILYNANPQSAESQPQTRQPRVGWDTLNWKHDGTVIPEWGSKATVQQTTWPWELLNGLDNAPEVKLNWQPKLIPTTAARLELAAKEMEGKLQRAMELASDHEGLVSH